MSTTPGHRARRGSTRLACLLVLLALAALLTACGRQGGTGVRQSVGGGVSVSLAALEGASASRGKTAIRRYGCGACHVIPGVPGANSYVGPPLTAFGDRRFVAGILRNDPENLIHWIQDPQAVLPGVDMPNMGVTPDDARDIAAYLFSLH